MAQRSTTAADGTSVDTDATAVVYAQLRRRLITGDIAPGAEVNQVRVAQELGISRGPIREALRRLESDGLVEYTRNMRVRATSLDASDAEQLYSLRVSAERLAVEITCAGADADLVARMEDCVSGMAAAVVSGDVESWRDHHDQLHAIMVSGVNGRLRRTIDDLREHAGRYVRLYMSESLSESQTLHKDHCDFVELYRNRDSAGARKLIVTHLAHGVWALLSMIDPAHEPDVLLLAVPPASRRGQKRGGRSTRTAPALTP